MTAFLTLYSMSLSSISTLSQIIKNYFRCRHTTLNKEHSVELDWTERQSCLIKLLDDRTVKETRAETKPICSSFFFNVLCYLQRICTMKSFLEVPSIWRCVCGKCFKRTKAFWEKHDVYVRVSVFPFYALLSDESYFLDKSLSKSSASKTLKTQETHCCAWKKLQEDIEVINQLPARRVKHMKF